MLGAVSPTIEGLSCFLHPRGGVRVCLWKEQKCERERRERASSSLLCLSFAPSANKRHKNKGQKMKNNEVESSSCACRFSAVLNLYACVWMCMCVPACAAPLQLSYTPPQHAWICICYFKPVIVYLCVYNELETKSGRSTVPSPQ